MKITITEKKEEPLLSRTKVRGAVTFESATPSNADLAKQLAKNLKGDDKLVVVKEIQKKFGTQNVPFEAVMYSKADEMYKIEGMEPPKEEASEESKPEEKPAEKEAAEEKKEEAPAEEAKPEEKSESKEESSADEKPAEEEKKE